MALTLEEIKKLPPRERIQKLREFEAEQKKLREDEEKRRKNEEEEIIKKSIEEITEEQEKQEEEEIKLEEKKEKEKKKQESLEEIAHEAHSENQNKKPDYLAAHQEYITRLSRIPNAELSVSTNELRESFEQRGYLTQKQLSYAEHIQEAIKAKKEAGYNPGGRSGFEMSEAEKTISEMLNPLKKMAYR